MIPRLDNHAIIVKYCSERPIESYLEIGVCGGYSMYHVLNETNVRIAVGIDTWGETYGGYGVGDYSKVIETLGHLSRKAILLTGNSADILPGLFGVFGVIFIDGDHSPEGCRIDMQNSLKLLGPGGVMLVDDIDNQAHLYLRDVVNKFAADNNLAISFDPAHCGVAILSRK